MLSVPFRHGRISAIPCWPIKILFSSLFSVTVFVATRNLQLVIYTITTHIRVGVCRYTATPPIGGGVDCSPLGFLLETQEYKVLICLGEQLIGGGVDYSPLVLMCLGE